MSPAQSQGNLPSVTEEAERVKLEKQLRSTEAAGAHEGTATHHGNVRTPAKAR